MVAPIEVTVDAKGMPLPSVDPNITLPPGVRAQAAAADALHAAAYQTQPQPQPQPQPVVTAPVTAQPQPQPQPQQIDGDRATWDAAKWMQHARSMEGRFKQSQDQINSLQGTLAEVGEELVRTQATIVRPQPQTTQTTPPVPAQPLLTQADVDTYGEDFLNVAQRAAIQAITPKLTQLERQNQVLTNQLRRQTIESINTAMDREVPNWMQINLSPRFKTWLRLRDIYSGRIRSELLNEAHRAADAARVASFFKGFLAEEEATGSTEFLQDSQPSPSLAAPHDPAVELSTLTAPGHARPAQGNQPTSADAPIYITRTQIKQFYENVRKGAYVGRDQDYLNDQAIIFDCQKHGRIR